jgi:hypothetical protein
MDAQGVRALIDLAVADGKALWPEQNFGPYSNPAANPFPWVLVALAGLGLWLALKK